MHSKGNYKQGEKTTLRMEENNSKQLTKVIKLRTLRWKIIVDYLGSPDVIMKIFIKGMQEGERQKKM